jgi:FdhD protein
VRRLPTLSQSRAPLTREIETLDHTGSKKLLSIPAERDLTVYLDKREIITLMTLGAQPELLVLGYLLNQRLIQSPSEIDSITVDWEVNSAAVTTRDPKAREQQIEARTAKKIVTTGCGQGSVFGAVMQDLDQLQLPYIDQAFITQAQLDALLEVMRLQDSVYKAAGSVHGCALFRGAPESLSGVELIFFVEDVGRHNAIDTIAGWMSMQGIDTQNPAPGQAYFFYTTGRLTSEMVIKSAQMGIAIVISRSGTTQMGYDIAQKLGVCAIGRAINKHFIAYSTLERLRLNISA